MSARHRSARGPALGAAALIAVAAGTACAADYPVRPLRLISPFSPGGGNDFISRTLAQALSKEFGQSVVVDNRPGANTIIGMEVVAKSAPDGHTLIMSSSSQAINATLYPKLPYDSVKSFTAISTVGASPLVIAVPISSPNQQHPCIDRNGEIETG